MKRIVPIIVYAIVLIFAGTLFFNDSKELVSSKDGITGIWTSKKCTGKEGDAIIKEAAIQFDDDGNCHFSRSMTFETNSSVLEQKIDGLCYLNGSKNKLKIEVEGQAKLEWTKFSHNGNTITIGSCEFTKVA